MKKNIVILLISFLLNFQFSNAQRSAIVNINAEGVPFSHFWSKCVGAGRAHEGLRASWLEQLQMVKKDCGFEYCRFHGLFHDDMFAYREADDRGKFNGKGVYNWQYIDDLFDRMLTIGVKPFVELGFFPKDIAKANSATQFWWKGNITPPDTLDKWKNLIYNFTKHCVERYGLAEVRTWYFEVWNEPNLKAFWDGNEDKYFELYKTSVQAIKSVDSLLKVGGPATSSFRKGKDAQGHTIFYGAWIEDFLNYCKKEQLPVDFISTHPYPHEWALDAEMEKVDISNIRPMTSTHDDMIWLRNALARSNFPHAEIHLTEWSSSASPRDYSHDQLPAAAYIIKTNLQCINLVNSLSYWTFTDVFEEKGAGNYIFHGGFGMINYQGLAKPSFHAYRMLNQLGNEMLYQDDAIFVSKNSNSKKISAIIIHYPEEMKGMGVPVSNAPNRKSAENVRLIGSPKEFSLVLKGLKPGNKFTVEIMDKTHANVVESWKNMGSPEPPTIEQIQLLKKASLDLSRETIFVDKNGMLSWKKTLDPWACVLIRQL